MPARVVRPSGLGEVAEHQLREGIAAIQAEQRVTPEFPAEVAAAATAAAQWWRERSTDRTDRTDLELFTLDPEGSRDLDQAMHLERAADGSGFVVHYAIADLAAFVTAGDPVDLEAHRRGETLYGGGSVVPLHPLALSHGAASLLPDQVCPAYLWTIALDAAGAVTSGGVERVTVGSRRRLSYEAVQADLDAGTEDPAIGLLREIGTLRQQQEADRGGVSLPLPSQEIEVDGDQWRLELREPAEVEGWNAQISLLTGIVAAGMMLEAKVGVVRTLPPAPDWSVERLRRRAKALRVNWPETQSYPDFVRSLNPSSPHHLAMLVACTSLLRGAGYAAFDGSLPAMTEHSALATPYAHVTAPLRRLVDRYGLETCACLSAGEPVPSWVREALPGLPETMTKSGQRAGAYEGAVLDLVEAQVLAPSVGTSFTGVVISSDRKNQCRGELQVTDPAVVARIDSAKPERPLPVGSAVDATLTEADPATRRVRFTV